MALLSIQPFGLEAPGGGPRILRSLYREAPTRVVSVVTSQQAPPLTAEWEEFHLPLRPSLGPIDGSRYDHWGHGMELMLAGRASRCLREMSVAQGADVIHATAHSAAFWPALQAARALELRFVLSVHDDLRYLLRAAPMRGLAETRLRRAWQNADHRFVISRALGEEYCVRYGRAPFAIVTDGLADADIIPPRRRDTVDLRCYFAGLFHRGYRPNLEVFLKALVILRGPNLAPALTCRCGSLPDLCGSDVPLSVLGFGSQADVRADLEAADLLYLPLMFDPQYRDMAAFSLSTKLITYLGSGVPIVYHGPADSAAGQLLAENDAAILATSSKPDTVAEVILEGLSRSHELVANAQSLARRQFMLEDQRSRFWRAVRPRTAAPV
jgi:glycosyltransferase involved in cell wall biosynthesis